MNPEVQFLESVVHALVSHPEAVQIERQVDELGVLLRLHVHRDDMGVLLGRKGHTSAAIRDLLRIVGIKNNARVNLKIEEPEGGRFPSRRPLHGPGSDCTLVGCAPCGSESI